MRCSTTPSAQHEAESMPSLTHPPLFDFPEKVRWLKCHFCGERVKKLEDGHIELCGIRDDGTLSYPSEDRDFTIILGHSACGPDVGYHFRLDRLVKEGAEEWIKHLQTKRWWMHGLENELRDAEKYARLIQEGENKAERLPALPSKGQRTMFSSPLPPPPKGNPRSISTGMRAFVMERDGFKCRRCNASAAEGARLVVDHVVAVANGGSGDHDNLQTLCWDCNSGKRDRAPHPHDLRPR